MGRRLQARRSGGQFTRNTFENTLGLSVQICPECRTLNPRDQFVRDEQGFVHKNPPLENCHKCGALLSERTK